MNVIFLLAPFSVVLGLIAVGAFVWTLRAGQYDDIQGSAERVLIDDDDDQPGPVGPESAAADAEGLDRG